MVCYKEPAALCVGRAGFDGGRLSQNKLGQLSGWELPERLMLRRIR